MSLPILSFLGGFFLPESSTRLKTPGLFRRSLRFILSLCWAAGLLFGGLSATAKPSPQQRTDYQRRLYAVRFDHRYWDAPNDSLRQVLPFQYTDVQRLQTLTHLFNLTDLSRESLSDLLDEHRQALELSRRLGYVEQEPLRQVVAFDQMALSPVPNWRAMLDTLRSALQAYDALGGGPQPYLLEWIEAVHSQLEQPEANRIFFTQRLAYEQQQGNVMNAAICYRMLGRYYGALGDYNQAISQRLRAAELFRTCSNFRYYNEIGAVGMSYTEWGNYARALPYLQKALTMPGTPPVTFYRVMNRTLSRAYLQLGRHAKALHYNARAQQPRPPEKMLPAYDQALGFIQQSLILLALDKTASVAPLLGKAQHLADSLHIPLRSYGGNCELQATWARYYTALGKLPQALKAWEAALAQARQEHQSVLRLNYLRALATTCQQLGQSDRAAGYGLAALALTDTLAAAQIATHVARYEFEQDERRQQAHLKRLRQAQGRTTNQVRQQRQQLLGLLTGLALLGGLAGLFYRTIRRQRRANALLFEQRQQLAQQAARLGQLDAAKNQFFANASHELRTPLTLVLAPLESLLSNPTPKLPAAVRGPVSLAYRQARRLHELVNRILDLTRLEAGQVPVQSVATAIAPLLRRVLSQFEPLAAARTLALYGPEPLPEDLYLWLDADKVEQILTNLLGNACHYTPSGGTVALTAALPAADGFYTLTVRDTGPGIAPEEQERVFERFYQSPQRQAQGGTGLGLALSRELASLLGGTLTLTSTPGEGAAFTLRLPAEVVEENQTHKMTESSLTQVQPPHVPLVGKGEPSVRPSSATETPQTRPRVLVVEDEPDLNAYLNDLLSPSYQVLTAADGLQALELLSREAPVDLILTDAMMPRLSGTELLARLKADPLRAGVPVLMLTARADAAHRQAALTIGVDDYLTKPFASAELLARVQVLLSRGQVRRQFAAQALEEPAESKATPGPEALTGAGELLTQWQALVTPHLSDEHFGPAELAQRLGLSERTLYRRLGELAGLTPAAWLRELRLHQARQLLESGQVSSVAQVADAMGFASAKHFSNLYAERFGRRPSSYLTTRS